MGQKLQLWIYEDELKQAVLEYVKSKILKDCCSIEQVTLCDKSAFVNLNHDPAKQEPQPNSTTPIV